jgi:cephalosporin hydroxylase
MSAEYKLTPEEQAIADRFHDLYYNKRVGPGRHRIWEQTKWMGYPVLKTPADLWIYQEILFETKPDLVIETGTYASGTTLFIAQMMDLIGKGRIVSIDVQELSVRARHPRITYLTGSSADPAVARSVASHAVPGGSCLVILDSDHTKSHVAAELALLAPLVTVGSYLIVEDSNVNGHPVYPSFGPGPYEAIAEFLNQNTSFAPDLSREKFLVSWNPNGYLRRIRQ